MATLETRVISGKGVLKLNVESEDYKKAKVFSLYVDVIRKPYNPYLNYNYNPPRSRYATICFFRGDYLIRTESIEYPMQVLDFYPEPSAQTMYAVQCAYAGILQTFFNLGNALSLPSISITDHIKDWKHIDLMWDTLKVVCYADTAIRVSVRTVPYDLCPEQSDKEPDPPPPPPEDTPAIPPGTPIDTDSDPPLSPPYTTPNDDGDTVPYPGDLIPVPPPVVGCWKITNSYSSTYPTGDTYVVGYSTDEPFFQLDGLWWQLHDAGSGRVMYYNWVGSTVTPTLISATFYEECPVPDPGGTLTGSP